MSEGPGIELYDENDELKEKATVGPPGGVAGTVSIQLFHGHPDDGELKEEAEVTP